MSQDRHSDNGGNDIGTGQQQQYNSNNNGPHLIPAMNRPALSSLPHPRLERIAPYLTITTLQAYTILTVVRCLADPYWIIPGDQAPGDIDPSQTAQIGHLEKSFLACAIAFTMVSCLGVTLRILDKLPSIRKIPVITAFLEAIFCTAALVSFLSTHSLPPGGQFSHGFLACVITVVFSIIVAIMLTIDWYRGFPSAGLSATLKALIISSFVMTIVIIIGAAIYSSLEEWSFDEAVNFCIVSFATIGYGDISPKTDAGRIIFFFYGLLGISSLGFFVVSLRNAVIEQFQWRLVDRFSKPAHLTRVQTRMSAKDMSFPAARFEEEQQVKIMVKRKMIVRMVFIWIVMWFGGAGIFCIFEKWSYLESLYFCFVTLTTIGFGDYVPKRPGSIEFWNVYVFVGLSVFAYILSLSSESMASQIHLVDDRDEEDDAEMYGWERNEDPNAPLTTRSGILGLEGLKWIQQQQQQGQQGIPINQNNRDDDQESKQYTARSHPGSSGMDHMSTIGGAIGGSGGSGQDDEMYSTNSSIQRSRPNRKSSGGKVLMVSAKERKQMLQAEYYANHSLPTTIRFIDTQGIPHQKVVRRGMSGSGALGGSGGGLGSENGSVMGNVEPHIVYNTVGYYGTVGRNDNFGTNLRRAVTNGFRNNNNFNYSNINNPQNFRGVGVANGGTMYGAGSANVLNELNRQRGISEDVGNNRAGQGERPRNAVQTEQLRHQPLIKFDSPKGSIRSAGGERSAKSSSRAQNDRSLPGSGYIPSCMDVFGGQNDNTLDDAGEGPSSSRQLGAEQQNLTTPTEEPAQSSRGRSNSWDFGTATSQMVGPSQNDVHRWLAEDAGTLEGPRFEYAKACAEEERTMADSFRQDQASAGFRGNIRDAGHDVSTNSGYATNQLLPCHRDGVAPDANAFSEEPEMMSESKTEELTSLHPEFVSTVHEPSLPRDRNPLHSTAATPSEQQDQSQLTTGTERLYLGGGVGAGYGTHAYGVPTVPNQHDAFDSIAANTYNATSPSSNIHNNFAHSIPASLYDDELDHQVTIHGSDSRPLSLFSNHYNRSGYNSPVESRVSSRTPSVRMTIFDEPVPVPPLSRPGSNNVSRSGSVVGQQGHGHGYGQGHVNQSSQSQSPSRSTSPTSPTSVRTGSVFTSIPPSGTVAPTGFGLGMSGIPSMSIGDSGGTNSRVPSPDANSLGPFDETRDAESIPHFEQEVDLNHLEMSPELI
ncbi:Potassium channel [Podila humilis]|nr:Potassium channel [Podila humilis]